MDTKRTGRNLVLCFDGTNNRYAASNTNVVKLLTLLDREGRDDQLFYYLPGVGTVAPHGRLSGFKRGALLGLDLAVAWLLPEHVQAGYRFLMRYYKPGDRIYLFGYSRGAYTARALAGMLHRCGLLAKGNEELVPLAWTMYAKERDFKVCGGFKKTFSRKVRVNFLGLFDTVSSFGWAWRPKWLPNTARNTSVDVVRHAVALDERRAKFAENLWGGADQTLSFKKQDVQQVWFAGSHSDIGRGRASLRWMLGEAAAVGLQLSEMALAERLKGDSGWLSPLIDSMRWPWTLVEWMPLPWRVRMGRFRNKPLWATRWGVHAGRARPVPANALLHESVRARLSEGGYERDGLPESPGFVGDRPLGRDEALRDVAA